MERNKITNLNKNDLNKDLFDTELMSYNSKTGKNEWVTPRVMTKTIYNDKGENLDDILQFTPDDLKQVLYEILNGAPEAYNSFKEVADALDKNKNSISEIFNEINRRVKKPKSGSPGQVLKLNESGEIIFADDKDTVYEHPKKHKPWEIETDTNNRFVSDEEKKTWNNKLDEDSYINNNLVDVCVYDNECYTMTLKEFASGMMRNIHTLYDEKGNPDGIATLNTNGKVPTDQLPDEALKDTTYDLSIYATNEDLKSYAKTSDLSAYAKSTDLENLAKSTDLDDYQKKLSYTPEDLNKKGKANGYASLDAKGQVPASQLPSYVDDVVEITSLPTTGEKGKIYVNINTNQVFRWSGSQFISIVDFTAMEEKLNKKPDVISLSEDEFSKLTTFKDNTLYLVQENA